MYVQCPHCKTVFSVSTHELSRAEGLVRCGACQSVFNGLDALSVLVPDGQPDEAVQAPRQLPLAPAQAAEAQAAPEPDRAEHERPAASVPPALAADLAQPRRRAGLAATLLWSALAMLLMATLAGQYVYDQRERLHRYPELQPWLQRFCALTRCELPAPRDVDQIELLSRNVYSHPNVEGALMITATLVNHAPYAQPYPLLGISLSDLQGRVVAQRRFRPEEYLHRPLGADELMEPGVPVNLSLEILDPGSEALAFEFDFQ